MSLVYSTWNLWFGPEARPADAVLYMMRRHCLRIIAKSSKQLDQDHPTASSREAWAHRSGQLQQRNLSLKHPFSKFPCRLVAAHLRHGLPAAAPFIVELSK
jgi:hypothetical protein